MPELRYLGLPELWSSVGSYHHYQLNAADVHGLARCCPSLQSLDCRYGGTLLPLQPSLSSLSHLTSLTTSSLPVDVSAVEVVTKLTALQRLRLAGLSLHTAAGSVALTPLLQCSRLTSLSFFNYGPAAVHDDAVATMAQLTNLVELDLSRVHTTAAQLLSLMPLVRLTHLSFSTGALKAAFMHQAAQVLGRPIGLFSPVHDIKVCQRMLISVSSVRYTVLHCRLEDLKSCPALLLSASLVVVKQKQCLLC